VGTPAPGSTIKILDDDGNELPAGETGLVYIGSDWGRGFRYAGPDELTESVYRGDLATLGDLGYLDEDGYLYVVDRRKDLVITGGANVYPAEVEAALDEHPRVVSSCVIGLPDEEYGNRVHAIVQAAGPVEPAELDKFLGERLVRYKVPRTYELVAEPLRGDDGKVRRSALRAARLSTGRP
jgi:bile acid-coenzyme A ligase